MTTADAALYGVSDRDVVEVAIDSDGRDLTFGDVIVRVKDSYKLEMHIDTDEANAADLSSGDGGVLIPTGGKARVLRRRVRPTAN
jgi:acetate kinase